MCIALSNYGYYVNHIILESFHATILFLYRFSQKSIPNRLCQCDFDLLIQIFLQSAETFQIIIHYLIFSMIASRYSAVVAVP